MVTELGLGAMDTPKSDEGEETLQQASDLGINFVDTARIYEGSEFLIGQVVRRGEAKRFHLATKTINRTRDGSQYDVDRSLQLLGVDRIDLYQLDDVSTEEDREQVMQEQGALTGLKIARERGLIGHIGISSHSLEILGKAIDCGEFDTVMLEYSAFYRDTEPLIAQAAPQDGVDLGEINGAYLKIVRPLTHRFSAQLDLLGPGDDNGADLGIALFRHLDQA